MNLYWAPTNMFHLKMWHPGSSWLVTVYVHAPQMSAEHPCAQVWGQLRYFWYRPRIYCHTPSRWINNSKRVLMTKWQHKNSLYLSSEVVTWWLKHVLMCLFSGLVYGNEQYCKDILEKLPNPSSDNNFKLVSALFHFESISNLVITLKFKWIAQMDKMPQI